MALISWVAKKWVGGGCGSGAGPERERDSCMRNEGGKSG